MEQNNMPVTPIKIKGKDYIDVASRVVLANEDEGYSMLREEVIELAGRAFVRVTIEAKGKQYIGTSEIKFGAKPGTADGDSPFECGQTSALGRALGFAGYGSVESIASADEVVRNEQQHRKASEKVVTVSTSHDTSTNGKETSRPSQTVTEANTEKVNNLLAEYEVLNPEYCGKTPGWKFKILRSVLQIASGPLPAAYSDDDVHRMDLFLAERRNKGAA
jgi:hypothetical protein